MATREQLETALRNADKAGDVEAAKALAAALKPMLHKPISATDGMSTGEKFWAGMGKGMTDIARGAGQMLGINSQQEIDEARRIDEPLMKTGAGMAGNIAGSVVPAAAAMFVPGANTVVGSGVVGGALSALQPTAENESRAKNAALGAVTGAGAQWGLGRLAGMAGNRLASSTAKGAAEQSQNAVRDATIREAIEAGYVAPPSDAGAGLFPRILEGVSGKAKTAQLASVKNQNVTDRLARRALNLSDDAPITTEAMQAVRNEAFKRGYEPVAQAGRIETDRLYLKALDDAIKDYTQASRSFPGAFKNDVAQRVNSLRTGVMDTGDALAATRLLRQEASDSFRGGRTDMGGALRKASQAIEDQVERALVAEGKDGAAMLKEFRDARTLMAKAHSVEDAIVEGGGSVDAKVLARALQRGDKLTGELKTIGSFANNTKGATAHPKTGDANPFDIFDFGFGALGSPALPIARVASRYGILSGPAQKMMGPSYGPGMLTRMTPQMLEELEKRGAGGLLGSGYASK